MSSFFGGSGGGDITFTTIETTSNGQGDNVKIGDDTWLGDIDFANTLGIKGVEDATKGYIQFGGNGKNLGSDSTGALTWDGSNVITASSLSGAISGTYAPINSPTFTGTVGGITKAMVGLGNVDNTTDANKPVSSATQTALNLKADLASPTFTGTVVAPNISATSITNSNSFGVFDIGGNTITGTVNVAADVTSGGINIGPNIVSGVLNIGTKAMASGTKTINLGTGGLNGTATNINIGSTETGAAGTVQFGGATVKLGTAQLQGGGISTGVTLFADTQSATISLGGNLTSGGVAIANSTSLNGTVAIASGSSATPTINIAAGTTSSGNKTVNIATGGTGTSTANVNIGTSANTTVNIASGATSTVYLPSTILGPSSSTSVNMFQTTASGSLSIGVGLSTGGVTIANGSSFSGTVTIAGGGITTGTKTINIGTGTGVGGTTSIAIGSTSGTSTTTLQGNVTVSSPLTVSTIVASGTAAGNLFNNVNNAGSVDMAAAAGTIHLGRSAATSQVNILANPAGSGTKEINIGTASTGGTTTITIGSSAGATSVTNLNGKVVLVAGNAPATATSTGTTGQVAWDANYFYVCTATNTWVRTALATW